MSDVATDAFREKLSRTPAEPLPGGDRLIICNQTRGGKLYSVPLSSLNYSGKTAKSVEATSVKNLTRRGVPPLFKLPAPSCHGYILLYHYDPSRIWAIWNPFTKECIELPEYEYNHFSGRREHSSGGIGYDLVSGDYKVVRISELVYARDGGVFYYALKTLIYSVKSKTWRRIGDYPNCRLRPFSHRETGVFNNGGLYWFAEIEMQGGQEDRIISFDLGTEKYRQIRMPPLASGSSKYPMDKYLDASDGCLFVSYSYGEQFNIWMLMDQGGENIWNKFVSLGRLYNVGIYFENPRLVSYSKSKKEVVIRNKDTLLRFDVEKNCLTNVSVGGVSECFCCQAFPTSPLDGSSIAKETTAWRGSLKRKRTIPKDSFVLKLKADVFQLPSHAGD